MTLNSDEKIAFISDVHLDSNTPDSRVDDMLSTCIYKMEDILSKCIENKVKAVFFEGDVVNRYGTAAIAISRFIEVLMKFRASGIELFTILGNHDIARNSVDTLERSPLQIMFAAGIIQHINLSTNVTINGDTLITPVDYTEFPISASESFSYNILLAHMFFDANKFMADDKHNLTQEQVESLGYDTIVLGHDHEKFDDVLVGKTTIIRHGSLLRGTAHNYNFTRKPNFLIMDMEHNFELIEVAHKDYKDIVSNYVLNRKQEGTISGLKDVLSSLATRLAMSSDQDGDRILEIIKTDKDLPNEVRLKLLNYITETN